VSQRRQCEPDLKLEETVQVSCLPFPAYLWRVVDGVMTLVGSNAAAAELEPATEEMVGMTVETLREHRPEIAECIERALRDRTVITAEGRYRRRFSGERRWLRATYAFVPPGTVIVHVDDLTDRHLHEVELEAAIARFRGAFEHSPIGTALIRVVGPQAGCLVEVNDAFCDLFGYPREELTGRRPPEALAYVEDDREGVEQMLALLAGELESCSFEKRFRRCDGEIITAEVCVSLVQPDRHGEPLALYHFQDVTERHRSAAALGASEARYRKIIETTSEGVWLIDEVDRTTFVNARMAAMLGYEVDEMLGRPLADFVWGPPPDIRGKFARAAGRPRPHETRLRHKDGTPLWASLSNDSLHDDEGRYTGALAMVSDITERRRAAEALEERERQLRAAFDLAVDGMLIAGDDRVCLEGNQAAAEMLGIPLEELAGRLLDEFTSTDIVPLWERFLAEGELTGELDLPRPDGTIRHAEFSARANFRPGRHISILRDVTDRRRADEARELSRRETERLEAALNQAQRLETVGQLAGGVAHDFNNILAVILNSSAFALEALGDHPAVEDIKAIDDAARRAATLTRQLLVFSRREIADPRVLEVSELVGNVDRLLRRTIGEHIHLALTSAPGLPAVEADPSHLEQVLLNLAVNARDAMPSGGTLTVNAGNVEIDDQSALRWGVHPGRYVQLTVTDTGCGMPEEVRRRAFEPFFTTKPKGSGTGLGLATTYGIVKQNGGHIELYSEVGTGTVATVYLPATELEPDRGRPVVPVPPANGSGQTILLVEDEEPVRAIAKRILTMHGYRVVAAANADEALSVATASVDLVLTDVVMPGESGPNLVRALRRQRPGLPAIFMSGYTDRPGALPADATFLSKPFSRHDLLEQVARGMEPGAS
jgi:PAS domain S-box-containing protein